MSAAEVSACSLLAEESEEEEKKSQVLMRDSVLVKVPKKKKKTQKKAKGSALKSSSEAASKGTALLLATEAHIRHLQRRIAALEKQMGESIFVLTTPEAHSRNSSMHDQTGYFAAESQEMIHLGDERKRSSIIQSALEMSPSARAGISGPRRSARQLSEINLDQIITAQFKRAHLIQKSPTNNKLT